jgi:hypothetical protein
MSFDARLPSLQATTALLVLIHTRGRIAQPRSML